MYYHRSLLTLLSLSSSLVFVACGGDDGDDETKGTSYVKIAAGGQHACAIATDGNVYCWGNGVNGQLGGGTPVDSNTPTQVPGLTNVVDIAAGWLHTCAVEQSGQAYCWGANPLGQHGNNTSEDSAAPVMVQGLSDARTIACGDAHSCATRADGTVQCLSLIHI